MGGSHGLIEKMWVQFVLTAGPANTEVAWTRDEVLVGSVNFRNHFVSFPIYIVVLHLVNHQKLECYHQFCRVWLVGLRLSIFTALNWRSVVWFCANVGEGHFWSVCCGRYRPLLQWCQTQVVSGGVSCGCCGWSGVPCCCFWCVACVGLDLRRIFGKWVQSKTGGVPIIRSAYSEAMPAKSVLFSLWVFGSLLNDWINCHALGGGKASRLDDVTFRSSSYHHYRRVVKAVASWGGQQHRGVWLLLVVYLKDTGRKIDGDNLVV